MARKQSGVRPGFGVRLRELRVAAANTQRGLAEELGISRRRVGYYEGETERPPAPLLPALAAVPGVATDALLRVAPLGRGTAKPDTRLQRRMQQIEKLSPRKRRQVLQLSDAFIEREQLRASKG